MELNRYLINCITYKNFFFFFLIRVFEKNKILNACSINFNHKRSDEPWSQQNKVFYEVKMPKKLFFDECYLHSEEEGTFEHGAPLVNVNKILVNNFSDP